MMETVYAVKSGLYSDTILHCLFDKEELAVAYIAAIVEAERLYEVALWGEDADVSYLGGAGHFRIVPLQLWSTLPVVSPNPSYEQRHSEVD